MYQNYKLTGMISCSYIYYIILNIQSCFKICYYVIYKRKLLDAIIVHIILEYKVINAICKNVMQTYEQKINKQETIEKLDDRYPFYNAH